MLSLPTYPGLRCHFYCLYIAITCNRLIVLNHILLIFSIVYNIIQIYFLYNTKNPALCTKNRQDFVIIKNKIFLYLD